MVDFKINNLTSYVGLGAAVGIIHFGLSFLIARFSGVQVNFATINVAAQREAFAGVGEQILKFSPFDPSAGVFMALLASVIAGVAVAVVGRLLYGLIPLDKFVPGKMTPSKRIASILVLGMLPLMWILPKAGLPTILTAVGLIVWAVVLGMLVTWLSGFRGSPVKIPQN